MPSLFLLLAALGTAHELDVFYVTADSTVAQSVLNGGWGTE